MAKLLRSHAFSVSVVIPSYNYAQYVVEAVESALRQAHPPLEIIVVDDGSTDNTAEVLQPYLNKIRYIHQKNSGLSAARNTGIRAARGTWVGILDSDDIWFENKLDLQMQCAAHHPGACLIGAYDEGSRRRRNQDQGQLFTLLTTSDLLGGIPFGASSAVARKDCLERAGGFNERRRSVEDREMWLKLTLNGFAARVNMPLWRYRKHPNQMNANPERMAENYESILSDFFTHHPEHGADKNYAFAYFHYDTAAAFYSTGKRSRALRHLFHSYSFSPTTLAQRGAENTFSRTAILLKILLGEWIFRCAPRRLAREGLARKLSWGKLKSWLRARRHSKS